MNIKQIPLLLVLISAYFVFNPKSNPKSNIQRNTPIGILISDKELLEIKEKAKMGIEPYRSDVKDFLSFIDSLGKASEQWAPLQDEVIIVGRSSSDPIQLSSTGGKLVYGLAIAWHLTGEESYALKAKNLILDLTSTYSYRNEEEKKFHWGAQGILNLARGGTPYIYAADLLEGWGKWTAADKLKYQAWLRDVMYSKVAWASRYRKNNWGTAGSFSAALIAYYLMDQPEWRLEEISPKAQKLTPKEAFAAHNAYQLGRQRTTKNWKLDAKVDLWGILPNGAIPEEIRRGNDPINGDHLPSDGSGTHYTMTYIEHLTAHAEFLSRLGDNSIYENIEKDGSGSLLKAYLFVIDNPKGSHCFTPNRINALYMAYNYYKHPAMLRSLKNCGPGNISGQRLALFGRLTHPLL